MKPLSATADCRALNEHVALAPPFLNRLTRLIRARDTYGLSENEPDADLLADFVVTKEQRRAISIIGDPDPDVLWRLDIFYNAGGLAIEERSGLMALPMMRISHEGFRAPASDDRAVHRSVEDPARRPSVGYEMFGAPGAKLVADAIAAIEAFPKGDGRDGTDFRAKRSSQALTICDGQPTQPRQSRPICFSG